MARATVKPKFATLHLTLPTGHEPRYLIITWMIIIPQITWPHSTARSVPPAWIPPRPSPWGTSWLQSRAFWNNKTPTENCFYHPFNYSHYTLTPSVRNEINAATGLLLSSRIAAGLASQDQVKLLPQWISIHGLLNWLPAFLPFLQFCCRRSARFHSEPGSPAGHSCWCLPLASMLCKCGQEASHALREVKWKSLSCVWLCDPIDCSLPSSSVHGILQTRILEWVAIPFSRENLQTRNRTHVSHIACGFFSTWAIRKPMAGLWLLSLKSLLV